MLANAKMLKTLFHASFLINLAAFVKCGPGLSWQKFFGFCFTSEVQCFNCVVWLLLNCLKSLGWNFLGLRLCESNLMKKHIDCLFLFQVLQSCGKCNSMPDSLCSFITQKFLFKRFFLFIPYIKFILKII